MRCCIMNESNEPVMAQKFTKIVATVGPASSSSEMLEGLIREGVNVIRLNFSHGEHAIHATTVERVRAIDEKLGTHTALLADMQGPKLRVGMMEDGAELIDGKVLTIKVGEGTGNAKWPGPGTTSSRPTSRPENPFCSTMANSASAFRRPMAPTR